MIPESTYDMSDFSLDELPISRTWTADFETKRITGMTDDIEALRQAIFLILSTERYKYVIYDRSFGSELNTLLHKHPSIVVSEAKRMTEEALLQDDRIREVRDISVTVDGTELSLSCTVRSVFGELTETFNTTLEV